MDTIWRFLWGQRVCTGDSWHSWGRRQGDYWWTVGPVPNTDYITVNVTLDDVAMMSCAKEKRSYNELVDCAVDVIALRETQEMSELWHMFLHFHWTPTGICRSSSKYMVLSLQQHFHYAYICVHLRMILVVESCLCQRNNALMLVVSCRARVQLCKGLKY